MSKLPDRIEKGGKLPTVRTSDTWPFLTDGTYPYVLCLLSVALFFTFLGSRDFWAPVEPRYAEIARVMFTKGEWMVPTINGKLYTDKPMLYFWLVLAGSNLAGMVNEWTVRLPSALACLGLILTTFTLGRELFNPRIGFMASIILATSSRVLWEARWAHTDIPFTFFFTLSIYLFSRAVFKKGTPKKFFLAYALMGLATLTKGFIGVVLPGLIFLAFVVLRRQWRMISEWRLPSGILIFLLITLPWFVWVSTATHGKWIEDFIFIQHIQRYLSGIGHRQPFYYYLINFPADFLPWTIFLVPAIYAYRSRITLLKDPIPLFLFLWFFVIFLFFSLSDTKRALYLLPAFPPVALFIASYFDDLISGNLFQGPLYRWLVYLFFHILWVSALSLPFVAWVLRKDVVWLSLPFAILMAAAGIISVFSVQRKLPDLVFCSTSLAVTLGMLYVAGWILPFVDQYKSPRSFAQKVNETVPSNQTLYVYANTMNDFNYYTKREVIPILTSRAQVKEIISPMKTAYVIIRNKDLKKTHLTDEVRILVTDRVGSKTWNLITLASPKK